MSCFAIHTRSVATVTTPCLPWARAVALPLPLAHHPQAMDEQVAGGVDGPPGIFTRHVFDKANSAPPDFVKQYSASYTKEVPKIPGFSEETGNLGDLGDEGDAAEN
ncbi:MAG: hypothetical protein JXA21_07275 [Anaerolineae bacterium]|nr:hypothetical protein [Anaerolineae bacterium]